MGEGTLAGVFPFLAAHEEEVVITGKLRSALGKEIEVRHVPFWAAHESTRLKENVSRLIAAIVVHDHANERLDSLFPFLRDIGDSGRDVSGEQLRRLWSDRPDVSWEGIGKLSSAAVRQRPGFGHTKTHRLVTRAVFVQLDSVVAGSSPTASHVDGGTPRHPTEQCEPIDDGGTSLNASGRAAASFVSADAAVLSVIGCPQQLRDLFPGLKAMDAKPIDVHALSTRARNALRRQRVRTWDELSAQSPAKIASWRGIGSKTTEELLLLAVCLSSPHAARHGSESPAATDTGAGATPRQGEFLCSLQRLAAYGIGELGLGKLGDFLCLRGEGFVRGGAEFDELQRALDDVLRFPLRDLADSLLDDYDLNALIRDFVQFDQRDLLILRSRVMNLQMPSTLEELGGKLGVSRERVRQLEVGLREELHLRSSSERFRPVVRLAKRLRDALGVATPTESLSSAIPAELLSVVHEELVRAQLPTLLWLAGPYSAAGSWLVAEPLDALKMRCRALLLSHSNCGAIERTRARDVLLQAGFQERSAELWLEKETDFRLADDTTLIDWSGTIPEKLERLLRYSGRPLTKGDIIAVAPELNEKSVVNAMLASPVFLRMAKDAYGLKEWGGTEYSGVVAAMQQYIRDNGGIAKVSSMADDLSRQFNVSPNSVVSYAGSWCFIRLGSGEVAVRESAPESVPARPLSSIKGCYRRRDGLWHFGVTVTADLIRGSGVPIAQSLAQHFEMTPGRTVSLSCGDRAISLSWAGPLPSVGSIRNELQRAGARPGDRAFLCRMRDALEVTVVLQADLAAVQGALRACALMGLSPPSDESRALFVIADALSLGRSNAANLSGAIRDALERRGEGDLAQLLDSEGAAFATTGATSCIEDAILSLGLEIARADGVVRTEEESLLEREALKHASELPESDRVLGASILARLRGRRADLPELVGRLRRTLDPGQRQQLLGFLVEIALADGELHPSEEELVWSLQAQLGVRSDFVERQLGRRAATVGVESTFSNTGDCERADTGHESDTGLVDEILDLLNG